MKNNTNINNYFLSRSLLLGGGLSIIFSRSHTDSYIAIILGVLLGIGILFLFTKYNNTNEPINQYLSGKKFINILFKICYFIYLLFLSFIFLIIISTFIYSYFLPFTPSIISCLPLIFLTSFLNIKSSKNITYIASILIVFSIAIVIFKTLILTNEFEFTNIFPILSQKPINIFESAITYAILTTAPYLTLLGEKTDYKCSLKYYLIANFTTFLVSLSITLTMGELINVYSYPEYSLLRKILFFNFIENIENFISVSWFFDIFIALSITSFKIKETLNVKNRLIPFAIVFIILLLVHHFVSDNFFNSMFIYKSFVYILGILSLTILILMIIKRKKQHR